MPKKGRIIILLILCGLFVLCDQALKYFARAFPDTTYYLSKPWIGWELYLNRGVAFSLPFPNWLIVLVTPLVLLFLVVWLLGRKDASLPAFAGVLLILSGAISNYVDRVLFGVTIDYIRLFTSVINLADVMIVAGAGVLLWGTKK